MTLIFLTQYFLFFLYLCIFFIIINHVSVILNIIFSTLAHTLLILISFCCIVIEKLLRYQHFWIRHSLRKIWNILIVLLKLSWVCVFLGFFWCYFYLLKKKHKSIKFTTWDSNVSLEKLNLFYFCYQKYLCLWVLT